MVAPVVEHRLQARRLSSCGTGVLLLPNMWDLRGAGIKLVSPALAGIFSSTETFRGSSYAPALSSGGSASPATSTRALPTSQGIRCNTRWWQLRASWEQSTDPPPPEQPPENLLLRLSMGRRGTGQLSGDTSRGPRLKEAISSGAMPGDSGSAPATAGSGPLSCPGASESSRRPSALGCSASPCAPGRGSLPGCPGSAWQPARPPGTWLQRLEPDNSGEGWGDRGRWKQGVEDNR